MSRTPPASVCVAALVALALVPGCEPTAGDAPVLLFSGNNDGVIAACGCPGNPSGGFAKRQGLIEQYRRSRPNVLLVDTGNLFPERANAVKVKYLARAAAEAEYDVLALGVGEFLLGLERLRELRDAYDLPFVCANVRDASGARVAAPHVVREVKGIQVGVFAVIADWVYGFPRLEWREGLAIEDPVVAARRQVEALAACDVIVAVSHQPMADTRRLAEEVEGIDLVLVGHEQKLLKTPQRVGGTWLVMANELGNFLGAVVLAPPPQVESPVYNVTFLSARVPGSRWVEDLYWEYVEEAKEKKPPTWDTPVPTVFEPAEACQPCHKAEYAQWKTTTHAHSWDVIKKAGRTDDPECVLCHTMGFGREGGFVSMKKTPGLGRVTCQGCHNTTSDHVERGLKVNARLDISSRLCMSCHGPIQSPEFDYYAYKPRILHHPPGKKKER